MNIFVACVSGVLFHALRIFVPSSFYLFEPLVAMARLCITQNIALAFFSLLPLPPLDGAKILAVILPPALAEKIERPSQTYFFILFALLLSGILSQLSGPIIWASHMVLVGTGYLFRFL